MKNAFTSILLLSVVGLAVLLAGAFYFGAPLFGWIIMIAIFAVFIVEQALALKKLRQMSAESEIIDECERRHIYSASGDGVVAARIRLAERLLSKGVRLDSPVAFEVLSTGASISIPRSASGSVILLGLMGTFFGLMYSVATAGGAIDNSTTQATLDTIQLLFQGMKGIFGTSLCGLFAALILNATRGILIANRDAFMSRLDSMTLDMQGSAVEEGEQNKSEIERLFQVVTKNLNSVVNSVQESLTGIVGKVGTDLAAVADKVSNNVNTSVEKIASNVGQSVDKLSSDMSKAVSGLNSLMEGMGKNLGESVASSFAPMEKSVKALADSVESIPGKLEDKLGGLSGSIQAGLSEATKNIADAVTEQVKQSGEQWKAFMDKLSSTTDANTEHQKEGLETLKNVALQVAEKAQAGSAELSQSVSEKISALSTDILGAFQKLSETSAVLLEAQKALTESIDNRVVKEKEATDALGGNIVETAELMRVNQSELSANLEMLRTGLESIMEKLNGDTAERDDEDNFVEHLNQTLEAFHERASEVLMENAVKTQEILLEVMEQMQRFSVSSASSATQQPKAEE
ncbi:MAG: fimbrial protein [Fibrobacter sp.]|nr:fimbrial protein [Fibrobacter sp.]